MERARGGSRAQAPEKKGRIHRALGICAILVLAGGLSGGGPSLLLAAEQGEAATGSAPALEVFRSPEENRAIAGISPRSFHRKGESWVRATGKDCRECHVPRAYPQGDFFGWEHRKKWVLHWWMFSASLLVMLPGIYSAVLLWRRGESPSLHHPLHWPSVMRALGRDVLLGDRVRRQSRLRWAVFELISIAFLALAVVFGLIVVQRFVLPLLGVTADGLGRALEFGADLLGGCILVGLLLAGVRRIAARGGHLKTEAEDVVVLLLLFGIVTTGFFLEACRLAVVEPDSGIWASFLGAAGAWLLRPWPLPWTAIRFYVWGIHAVLVFLFFAYLPFSKLFHILTAPVSIAATASEAHYKQRQ